MSISYFVESRQMYCEHMESRSGLKGDMKEFEHVCDEYGTAKEK